MDLQVIVWLCYCFLLPAVLLTACLLRYNILSLVYFLYLLLLPWFLCPNKHTIRGHTGRFIRAVFCTSLLFVLAHICFQTVLYTYPPLNIGIGDNCSQWDAITSHIGVSRLPLDDLWSVLRLLCPDLGVCVVSLVTVILCSRLVRNREMVAAANITSLEDDPTDANAEGEDDAEDEEEEQEEEVEVEEETSGNEDDEERSLPAEEVSTATRAKQMPERLKVIARKVLRDLGRILAISLLALAGITLPSAFSAVYFLLFIGVCTWWAYNLPISHLGFNALCVMVGFFTAGHMVCLYLYQSLLAQALFPPHSLWARLFGLKDIIIPGNCSSPYELNLNADYDWPVYVNPGILFLLYITIVTVLKTGRHGTPNQVDGQQQQQQQEEEEKKGEELKLDELELRSWNQQKENYEEETQLMLLSGGSRGGTVGEESQPDLGDLEQETGVSGVPSGQQSESPFFLLGKVVMQQSYVCALIAMMVWSITYHSWLTFVLLLWACLIWILRARRHAATLCSPFILLYGLALCCLQYVWAMELQPELPTTVGTMSLRQLGLDRAQYPCLRLGAMLLFTLTFWLLVRQSVKENFSRKRKMATPLQEVTTGAAEEAGSESVLRVLGGMVMSCYAKYWIYVCGGMFIMVSFAGKLVGYKIIYMLLFLLCLCLYQVYYSLWRRLLKLFWWLVVAYTMLVLISIYTYQFEDFPGYWRNFTGFTEEQLAAIGLETFALSELFSSILIPGFFLLACILQLHYFHKPFMRITNLEHVTPIHKKKSSERTEPVGPGNEGVNFEEDDLATTMDEESEDEEELGPSKWGLVMDRLLVLSRRFYDNLTKVQVFLWRLLELHILKMVAFFSVWVALEEPSVMNLVLVVLWSLAMPYGRFRPMASCLSTVWVCVIIVCKMLYQLSVVNPIEYSSNCSLPLINQTNLLPEEMVNSSLYKDPVDPANWFGIRKDATVLGYSKNHLIVLMLLVFEATVYRHQAHHYRQLQRSPPTIPALFPAATRDTLDQGLLSCIKYLLNYTFYKFGLEICFLMTVNVIGQRMNFLVIIHGCWLVAILVKRRRAAIAGIWPRYCLFLSVFMIYQYLLCVGMPPALCIDYPWRWNTPVLMNSALIKWIFLPDFFTVPNSKNLIADFVLLICASQQWKVFECEHTEEWMVPAGENKDDPEPMEGRLFNPAPNFINCRSYLDMAKVLVFRYLFWFVLSVVFVTGATRISVFGLGYLLACFFFLLFGTQLLVKPSRTRLALWDCLIIYNVAVIISKNMLSILACVFVFEMQKGFCWVIQLFSLVCTVKGYYDPKAVSDKTCSLPVEEAGIMWDSICFLCLLLQRRVFLSFYFLHVTAELQASAKQASRGFELFRASIVKNIKFHQQAEKKSLSQLKRSMQRIRSKQQKYREGHKTSEDANESPTAETQSEKKKSKKKEWHRPWLDHATVLHSGEYYLFESDSEDEEDLQSEEQKPQKQTACQLAYQAWVTSVKAALRDRQRRQRQLRRMERKEKERQQRLDSQQQAAFSAIGSGDDVFEDPVVQGEVAEEQESGHGEMVQRILDILRFLWAIVLAMVDGLVQWLNLLTKQYRETSTVLCNERYFIIHKIQQHHTTADSTDDQLSMDSDSPTLESCLDETDAENFTGYSFLEVDSSRVSGRCTPRPRRHSTGNLLSPEPPSSSSMELLPESSKQQHRYSRTASELLGDRQFFIEELEQSREFYTDQNRLLKLLFAMHNLLAANSELVCYFIIVLNNVASASVISLVLPILVFLWAMLAVPRPTKKFWMTAIVYTEVMVLVKYLFQFGFFPWNSVYEMTLNEDKPFFPPRILGLEKTDNYIKYDLLQLLVLFFHRSLLMRYGLWDHEGPLEEQSPSPESCKDEGKTGAEGDEDGRRQEGGGGGGEEEEEGRVTSTSTLDNLEVTQQDQFEKGSVDSVELNASFAAAATPQVSEAEPAAPVGSKDEQDAPEPPSTPTGEGDDERAIEEAPKKSSSIRFRRKSKQAKQQRGKGLNSSSVPVPPVPVEPAAESPDPSKEPAKKKKKGRRREAATQRLLAAGNKIKHVFLSGVQSVYGPAQGFFSDILQAEYRAATDVYALMFLTDVIDFIIVVFGFWAFGKHSAAADIASSLSEDQVPEAFLVMLLIQFSTMIIDRALYLRKAVLGKLIFQVILVFGIHLWMFFILPAVTERKFNQNFVAQLWYFVKCIYFGLSAYQIRCGYPTRILGNFLTKKYNHLNLFLFQGFRLVPFLVELRAVMDWVWTDTTLSLSNWMCVEDIYANIFIIKCSRETEKKYPQPKGQKKKKIVKYGMGGLIIFFLICIIWFPLLFISLVRSVVGVVNHPIDVTVTVKLGGYEPLFTMSVQQQSIQPFTEAEYEQLTQKFGDNAVAMQFITLYSYEDIVTSMIEGSSGSVWRISPPSRQEVIKELLGSPVDLTLRLAWTFQRDLGKGGTVEHTFDKYSIDLEPSNPVRADLASLLVGNRTEPVLVPNMFPNYIRAPNGAEAKPVGQLFKDNEAGYLNITLSLMSDGSLNDSRNQEWWDIAIAGCAPASCGVLPMVIFNDKVSPPSLGFLAGYGIMGLYVSVVLVIGKFVRGFFSEISHSIMFEELPCVDRILKLCTDIFLVRETGELELEEELYSKLIFLYRSPETMIKWTRDIHGREHDRY
ncbi:piezo-type mechanosensitive ion channel component 1 isoform X3 [Scophthalmus maximus]|uniref:piezo-type mechanosensitive ion channel component 1 isoform X3 n=1 Tax=Scophthalmus maximus TaxID=52904 RepID=UPI001FA940A8|nr:piezo-type mechanosensitive ion channel component 1 isoform X3 [Scophthalmus maximus]